MSWNGLIILLWGAIFWGCGMMSNPKDDSSSDTKKIELPQKTTLLVPTALRSSSSQKREIKNKDLNLDWVNEYVISIEDIIQEQKLFILFANQIMPKLNQLCVDKTTCTLASNQLQLDISTQLIEEIHLINSEIEIDKNITNTHLGFGEISLTKKSDGYRLTADIGNIVSKLYDINLTKQIESIEWSSDNKKVISDYAYSDAESENSFRLTYLEHPNGQNDMNISEQYTDTKTKENYTFAFALSELNDANKTQKIYSHLLSQDLNESKQLETSSYLTNGEITTNGGYLYSSITMGDFTYKDKSLFDDQGELEELISCYSDEECRMEDESTWIEEDIEPIYELTIQGGDLVDGEYYFISVAEEDEEIEIAGQFYIEGSIRYGYLYEEFVAELDELIVVYTKEDEIYFVEEKEMPIFSVKE